MRRVLRTVVGVAAGLIVAGCQATGAAKPVAGEVASTQAVTCSKCEVKYVQYKGIGDKGRVVNAVRKEMECPDCKSAAANFFSTGKFQHTCKTCGDTMELCANH